MYQVRATFTARVRPMRIEYLNVFGWIPQIVAASATRIIGVPNTSRCLVGIVEFVLLGYIDTMVSGACPFPLLIPTGG